MVEFGLKLEDNKVAEWSDYYIDYEKLKYLLKKAKEAAKRRDELIKRHPALAAEVEEAYKAGTLEFSSQPNSLGPSRASSMVDLPGLGGTEGKGSKTRLVSPTPETEALLKGSPDKKLKYGSQDSHGSLRSLGSDQKVPDSSVHALFKGVAGYFSKSNYEQKLGDALRSADYKHDVFGDCLTDQLKKVNIFYAEKLEELESRLELLVESVHSSNHFALAKKISSAENTPKAGHLRKLSVTEMFNRLRRHTPAKNGGIELIDDELSDTEDKLSDRNEHKAKVRESDSISRAIVDQYRVAKLLHNFSIINYTGFVKIVKKHDKTFPDHKGEYKDFTKSSNVCNEGVGAELIANRMEKLYADWFCGGNEREAHAQMLPKRGDGLQMDWSQLRLGYRLGMCSILTLWVCWDCIWGLVNSGNVTIGGRTAFPVFRACGGLVLLHWCWGISVYVWSRYRINYIYLFDFNPKLVDSPTKIFNDVVDENLIYLVIMLLYYKSGAHAIPDVVPPGVYPFILVLFAIKNLIFPWRTRSVMWGKIWEVVTAPMWEVTFFTTYIGDVLTSMVKVFQDVAWTLGFILSGDFLVPEDDDASAKHEWQHSFWYKNVLIPLVCLFPLWFRFNQCLRRYLDTRKRFPNLANAFKYAMSQTVTLFGAFHPLYLDWHHEHGVEGGTNLFQIFWMVLFISSSLYSYVWDVYMDWGLGRPKYGFLGPRLMFPNRWWYYAVMAADFVLRFMWVQSLIPPQSGASFEIPQYLTAVTMSLELLRRTVWAFFRLENEHRSNTANYRRVSFVPLHFNTGHRHKYTQEKEHTGWRVLAEVAAVSLLVIGISVFSVISAQRASRLTKQIGEL